MKLSQVSLDFLRRGDSLTDFVHYYRRPFDRRRFSTPGGCSAGVWQSQAQKPEKTHVSGLAMASWQNDVWSSEALVFASVQWPP